MATIWYRLPKIHRKNQITLRRVKCFYFSELTFLATFWVYLLLGKIFLSIPRRYQWILAIFVPFLREVICRGMTVICDKDENSKKNAIHTICGSCPHRIEDRFKKVTSISVHTIHTISG